MAFDAEQFRQDNLSFLFERVMEQAAKEREAQQKAVQAFEDVGSNLSSFERTLLLQGAAWQRQQAWEPHVRDIYEANPVLEDAILYFMERLGMNNPKDWAHVLRIIQRRRPEDFGPRATQEHYDEAVETIRQWHKREQQA